jgi:chemotaxis methyl-accepting protein methylase
MPHLDRTQLCLDLDLPPGSTCGAIVQRFKEIYGVEAPSDEAPCDSCAAEQRFYRSANEFLHQGLPTTTSWFRDLPSLKAVREVVLASAPERVTKIVSAGCATGEEAYSVLLSLWDLRERISTEAFDVNPRALDHARAGVYRDSPGPDLFTQPGRDLVHLSTGGWEVDPEARARISFRHHNLLSSPYPAHTDLILMQNVAPHFEVEGKTLLLRHALESLAPGGMLLLESIDPFDRFRDTLWTRDESGDILASLGAFPVQIPVPTWWGGREPDPAVRLFRR